MKKSIAIGKKGENKVAEMLREWWGDEHFIKIEYSQDIIRARFATERQ